MKRGGESMEKVEPWCHVLRRRLVQADGWIVVTAGEIFLKRLFASQYN
jgi:hypothetical protein